MRCHAPCAVITLVATCCLSASAGAGSVLWDESINGDLSNDRLNPTALVPAMGVNSITATSVSGDREYVSLTLAPGTQLSSITLVSYVGIDETAFIGVQVGGILSEPPTGTNAGNLLGWVHFGPLENNVGTDILDDMGLGSGTIGFTGPLAANTYTFWMQQTGVNAATFQFDFLVEVPAPPSLALLGLVAIRSRRRCC